MGVVEGVGHYALCAGKEQVDSMCTESYIGYIIDITMVMVQVYVLSIQTHFVDYDNKISV